MNNYTKKYLKIKYIAILVIATLLTSCATLPKAAVEMSVLLEKQIDILENNHISMINNYFEEKKLHAKTIIDKKWYPLFLEDFFKKDVVKEIWDEAIKSDDSEERIEAFKDVVQVVQEKYNETLNSMIEPLEKLRIECLTTVQEEYQKAKWMNRVISENISSVHKVQEARNRLMPQNMKNIEDMMYQYMQKADNVMNEVQTIINEYDKNK
jgi:hypothetical protein